MGIKICFATTIDRTIEEFIIPSARELKKKNYEITFVSNMTNDFFVKYSDEFNLVNINLSRGINFKGLFIDFFNVFVFLKKNKFDLIQYSTPNASFIFSICSAYYRVPVRLYKQWGIRYVTLNGFKRCLFKMIEYLTCLFSTDIRAVSNLNLKFAINQNLYPKRKVKIIGKGGAVGVDLQKFDVSKKHIFKKSLLNKYHFLESSTVLGYVGRLCDDKGIHDLLNAFNLICKKRKDIYLMLVGNRDPGFKVNIKNEKIIEIGHSKEVEKYLSIFDILIHPSHREGFSLVIQQAMSMQVPVITTNIPGPSEVIEENICGLLVEAKDHIDLTKKILHLAGDSLLIAKFKKNGYQRVKKYFSVNIMNNLIVEDFDKLILKENN